MEMSKTRSWLASVKAAIMDHPIASALCGLSAGYLLATLGNRRQGNVIARAIAQRVLVATGGLVARAAYDRQMHPSLS